MKAVFIKQNKVLFKTILLPLFFILFAIISCFTIFDVNLFANNGKIIDANASTQITDANSYDLPTEYSLYNVTTILNYFSAENRQKNCANLPQNVGDQKQVGICWAFATLTAFESSLYKTGTASLSENLNFSELHLAYTTQVVNRDNSSVGAGAFSLGYEYISSEQGPVYEQSGEKSGDWSDDSSVTDYYAKNYYKNAQQANYTALESYYYPSRSKLSTEDEKIALRNSIKHHIKTYGAVTASIYYDETQLINGNIQNYMGPNHSNHDIVLVGWDDDFSYPVANGASYTGAYIAQNSHGTDEGFGGYFYIMYSDVNVEENVAGFTRLEKTNPDNITYNNLEGTSFNNQFLTDNGSFCYCECRLPDIAYKMANIYKVKDINNQYVSRIKVPTAITLEEETQFYVYVLCGLTEEDVISDNVITEMLAQKNSAAQKVENINATTSDKYLFESNQTGFYTVNVKQEIFLTGEYFAVFVEYISGPIYAKANVLKDDGLVSKNMTYYSPSSYNNWQQYSFESNSTNTSCILPMYIKTDYTLGTIDYTCEDIQKEYDAEIVQPKITVANLLAPNYEISYSLDGLNWSQTLNIKNVDNYTVYFKIEADFYNTVQSSFQVEILPKQITVTPVSQYKIYGNNDSILDYVSKGYFESPKFLGALTRESGENVGFYDIYIGTLKIVDNGVFIASNYTLAFNDGEEKFQIKPRPIYITAKSTSKIYGDLDPTINYDYINQIETPSFSGNLSREAGEDVNSYDVVQNNLSLVDNPSNQFYASNYQIVFLSENNADKFNITPRPIIITPKENQQKTYLAKDPIFEFNYSNVLEDHEPLFAGYVTREVGENVGNYPYNIGSLVVEDNGEFLKKNYTLVLSDEEIFFSINYGTLTDCFVNDRTVYYNGQNQSLNPTSKTIDGVVIWHSLDNDTFIQGNISFKDAGEYTVYYKFEKANYNPYYAQATLTINQFNLIISPLGNQYKVYGEADPVLLFTEHEIVEGETPVYTGNLSRKSGEDVNSYLITKGDIELSSSDNFNAKNYNLVFNNLNNINFEITQRELVVCPNKNQFKIYGHAEPVLTFEFKNTILNQMPAYTGLLTRENQEDVGFYKINQGSLELINSLDNSFIASNYTLKFSQDEVLFEVKKANIVITIDDVSSYYGDDVITTFTSEISGDYKSTDSLDIEYYCDVDKFTLKGKYPIFANVKNKKALNNYEITVVKGNYEVKYKTYKVEFVVLNDVIKTISVEHFSKIDILDVPNVDVAGYTFIEWRIYEDDLSYTVVNFEEDEVTSNVTLTADMKQRKYIISLYTNNNQNDVINVPYTIKDKDFELIVPKMQGYTFDGWFESVSFEGNSVSVINKGSYGDKSFYAKWNINSYTITLPTTTTGYTIIYSGDLTREYNSSFEFKIIFEEQYSQSADSVQVSYLTKKAENKKQISSSTATFVIPQITEDTQVFVENVKLNSYKIRFVLDNQVVKTISKTYNDTLYIDEYPQIPVKENYDQVLPKWNYDNGIIHVTQDYDIVANYIPNVYEVVIVTQYGNKATQLITYGEKIDEEQLREQLKLGVFEYLVFDRSISDIDSNITINAQVQSRIYILYIVIAGVGGVSLIVILFFVIRKIKRRKFSWWGYASDPTKFNKKK